MFPDIVNHTLFCDLIYLLGRCMIRAHPDDLSASGGSYKWLDILLDEISHLIAGRKEIHHIKTPKCGNRCIYVRQ